MPDIGSIDDLGELAGKSVLVRVDLNVPVVGGKITDDSRIRAHIPTIRKLLDSGARVLLLSHFGRPGGKPVEDLSLAPLAEPLAELAGADVRFIGALIGEGGEAEIEAASEPVILLENVRFYPGEALNDADLARAFAGLGEAFVNDAFSAAHRAHASTVGLARLLPSVAGDSMLREIEALEAVLGNPERPLAAVVGGAKVSSKLGVLEHLVSRVDHLIIGGGMANTFLEAQGIEVGASLSEHEMKAAALAILEKAATGGCQVHLPSDVVVARKLKAGAETRIIPVAEVARDEMILDLGPRSVEALTGLLGQVKTLIWNGPLGAFEVPPFDKGTVALARAAAELSGAGKLLTVAGGGDTAAALDQAGVREQFDHVSIAGGAFLDWMAGKELPAITALGSSG
ncbi:MAG: phosphoglycerate kinase [Sphingomonadales bacterium]